MAPPFSPAEYQARLARVHAALAERGLDAMLVSNPANINWLTGYDAWSFYTPQMMLVEAGAGPVWLGREMDAGAARFTTYLPPAQVVPWPEPYVHRPDMHPGEFIGDWLREHGLNGKRIGYESDAYFLSPRLLAAVSGRLPAATMVDADLLVDWLRLVKSEVEIAMLAQAAVLAGCSMRAALNGLRPGVRQCDLMADTIAAQIRGTAEFGGDMTAVHPLLLAGEAASTAHPMWTDAPFETGQVVAFELGGCRKRYNAGLARTAHLGKPPQKLVDTSKAVEEGMEAVLSTLRAGVAAGEVHAAWQRVLDRYGLEKKSRIGYSIGVAYAPDWGEHTLSLRPREATVVPENAVVHVILGMWMDDWGMESSETIHVRATDCVCLTQFPRGVHVVD